MKTTFLEDILAALKPFNQEREQERQDIARYLAQVFVSLQRLTGPDLSLEIGAREATYSRTVRSVLPGAVPVVAFEGSPTTYAYYSKEMALFHPGVQYLPLIVSDRDGQRDFLEFIAKKEKTNESSNVSAGLSSMIEGRVVPDYYDKKTVTGASVAGDTFLRGNFPEKKDIALWIDVEGAQDEVLRGFEDAFGQGRIASVLIEVESVKFWKQQAMLAPDVAAHMAARGMVACFCDNQFIQQYNAVYIRKDVLARHVKAIRKLADDYLACIRNIV